MSAATTPQPARGLRHRRDALRHEGSNLWSTPSLPNVTILDSHAPTSAAGVDEPGVSHRSSLGILMRPIEAISAVLLVGLIGLVLASVFWRYVLGSPITASDEIASFIFLWIVMFGSVIAIDRNEHMRLAMLLNAVRPRARRLLEAVGLVIMAAFLGALLPAAIEHTYFEGDVVSPAPRDLHGLAHRRASRSASC